VFRLKKVRVKGRCSGAEYNLQNPYDEAGGGGWYYADSAKKCSVYTVAYEYITSEEVTACVGSGNSDFGGVSRTGWIGRYSSRDA